MGITFEEARNIAEEYVDDAFLQDENKIVIIDSATIKKDYGWYFFSQTKKYLETKNPLDGVVGNGPILVKKENGEVIRFGTALPVEEYIEMYEIGKL
jgi:hypothetical protein